MRRIGRDRALLFGGKSGPSITNITVSVVDSYYAIITWNTSVNTTSRVQYGTTTAYGTTTSNSTPTKNHSVMINANSVGLIQNQLYHYKVGDIAGTFSSSDQTFTTVRLKVPLVGPYLYAGLTAPFVDTLPNYHPTISQANQTTIAAPGQYGTLIVDGCELSADPSNGYPSGWGWGDTLQLINLGILSANGQIGGTASVVLDCMCTPINYIGGNGAYGVSGGGGGGASNRCCGDGPGGIGGLGTPGGDGGAAGCGNVAGTGGGASGLEGGYDGTGVGAFGLNLNTVLPAGGSGGNVYCQPGAGGGGGASGGFLWEVVNNLFNCAGGEVDSLGGSPGPGTGGGCLFGQPGQAGPMIFMARKSDGSIGSASINANWFYVVEIIGTQNGAKTYVLHTNAGDSWDHLYQP